MAFLHFFSFFVVPLPAKPLPVLFIHSIFLLRFSTFPCTSQQSSSSFFFSFSFSPLPFNLPTLPFSPFLLSITYFFYCIFSVYISGPSFFHLIVSYYIPSLHPNLPLTFQRPTFTFYLSLPCCLPPWERHATKRLQVGPRPLSRSQKLSIRSGRLWPLCCRLRRCLGPRSARYQGRR